MPSRPVIRISHSLPTSGQAWCIPTCKRGTPDEHDNPWKEAIVGAFPELMAGTHGPPSDHFHFLEWHLVQHQAMDVCMLAGVQSFSAKRPLLEAAGPHLRGMVRWKGAAYSEPHDFQAQPRGCQRRRRGRLGKLAQLGKLHRP